MTVNAAHNALTKQIDKVPLAEAGYPEEHFRGKSAAEQPQVVVQLPSIEAAEVVRCLALQVPGSRVTGITVVGAEKPPESAKVLTIPGKNRKGNLDTRRVAVLDLGVEPGVHPGHSGTSSRPGALGSPQSWSGSPLRRSYSPTPPSFGTRSARRESRRPTAG